MGSRTRRIFDTVADTGSCWKHVEAQQGRKQDWLVAAPIETDRGWLVF
jgi:hypothetical protein